MDYEPLSSRDEYQPSAIMYICGGASSSHPYVQELVEWREKQGYIVYLIQESEAGSSANSIKLFLQSGMFVMTELSTFSLSLSFPLRCSSCASCKVA